MAPSVLLSYADFYFAPRHLHCPTELQLNGVVDADAAFQEFTLQNKNWLPSYAIFCHLREKYKAANGNPLHWKDWDEQLMQPSDERSPRESAAQASGPQAAAPESPSRRRLAATPKTLRATPVAPASGSAPAAPSSPAPPPLQRRHTPGSLSDHFPRISNQPTSFRIKRGARYFKFEDLFAVYGPRVGVYYYLQVTSTTL